MKYKLSLTDKIYLFGKYVQFFGLFRGVYYYLILRVFTFEKVQLKEYAQPIYLRKNTSDLILFEEILICGEYNLNFPRNLNARTIIDAGANIGLSSLYFKKRFPSSKIISIEPNEENFQILQMNIAKYKDIQAIKAGIWYKHCKLKITDEKANKWGFMIEESGSDYGIDAYTINDIVNENKLNRIDILKIDIEGSEKVIFNGDYNAWLSITKVLIIETHDRMVEGSSKPLLEAVSKYNFDLATKSDFLIFTNRDLK